MMMSKRAQALSLVSEMKHQTMMMTNRIRNKTPNDDDVKMGASSLSRIRNETPNDDDDESYQKQNTKR